MFKILIVSLVVAQSYAVPSGYGGYGGGLSDGYGLGGGYGGGLGYGGGDHGVAVNAAILSQRHVQVIPTPSHYGQSAPTVVDIDASEQPVVLNFNSRSSPLHVTQNHHGHHGSHQSSHSVDEPHVLSHEVTRPVLQEIREIIVPQRNIVQEIKPVIENVQTLVAKGDGRGLGGGLGLGSGLGAGLALGGHGETLALGGHGTLGASYGLGLGKGY